jgi:MFS transporter, CP family, cyanate transporter
MKGADTDPTAESIVVSGSSSYRWIMLALLWLLYVSFGLVTRSLFPLVTPILRDLRMTYSQMGLVMGSWQFTYICAAMAVGFLVDRWGIRKSLFFGAAVIALSAGLRCVSTGFLSLLIPVSLFGIGGPMISAGAPKTIALWFQGKARGTAVGVYLTGPWIGGAFSLAATNHWVMPLVGDSWRLTFAVYGLVALVIAFLWLFLSRESETVSPSGTSGMRQVFMALVGVPNVRTVLYCGMLTLAIVHGLTSWLPKIIEIKGFPPIFAGYAAAFPLIGGIPSLLILPRMVPARSRGTALAVLALVAAASVWILFTQTGIPMFAGLVLYGVSSSALLPLQTLILMETPEVGPRHMGSASGLFFCIAEIGGFASPAVVGALADWSGGFHAGAYFVVALCAAVFLMSLTIRKPSAVGSTDK